MMIFRAPCVVAAQHCIQSKDLHRALSVDAVMSSTSLNECGYKPVYLVAESISRLCEVCLDFLHNLPRHLSRHATVPGNASGR